jgi:sulfane dehydrogenase subunit SoxC
MIPTTDPTASEDSMGNRPFRRVSRRGFLGHTVALLAATGLVPRRTDDATAAEPPEVPPWMKAPGAGFTPYGAPSKYESKVTRTAMRSQPGTTGSGAIRTPLEALEGTITPSGLHFERSHSGVPDIDPDQHRLLIHGLVTRPLVFTVDALLRYPMVSRIHFLECSGNSQLLYQPTPPTLTAGQTHGLVSCSDWTGVPLRLVLEEAGVERGAEWILAEGADAAAMSRSIPMAKAMDDAMLALFQNGERLRPENGYPLRLFLPGWEGNMSVKWLRRLKVVAAPVMTKDETSRYTDLQRDGTALMFTYPMEVKSVITQPSHGMTLKGAGLYQISGLAWSGNGRIRKVDVTTDGGATWRAATLTGPVLPRAVTRFRLPWRWDGGATVLKSRATDDAGHVQPERQKFIAEHGGNAIFHYNAIAAWSVAPNGEVKHVYA